MNGKEGLTHPTGKSLKNKKFAPCLLQRWHRNLLQPAEATENLKRRKVLGASQEKRPNPQNPEKFRFSVDLTFPG